MTIDIESLVAPQRGESVPEVRPPESLCVRIAGHTRSHPERLAVADVDVTLSYAELDRRADALATRLLELGAGPECCVAILLERCARFVVTALAVLNSGVGYLPLDVSAPEVRTSTILADAGVRRLREHVKDIAERPRDTVLARGDATMDLMADLTEPLPAIVTAELLGIPTEDHEQLKDWSVTIAEMLGNFQHNPDRLGGVLRAVQNLTAYFTDAIERQHRQPREGLIQTLLTSEVNGDRLTDEEVVANCIVTMVGGLETTTNLIGNGVLTLRAAGGPLVWRENLGLRGLESLPLIVGPS